MEEISSLVALAASAAPLRLRHEAFSEIVRRFQDMAIGCAYSVLGDFSLAEDAAQEAFITAWKEIQKLRDPHAFPRWFKQVVLSQCCRLTRGKRLPVAPLEVGIEVGSTDGDPYQALERQEMTLQVRQAIAALPEHERLVTVLFYIDDYSYSDICAFLGLPLSTIKKRLFSARQRLRALLSGDGDEPDPNSGGAATRRGRAADGPIRLLGGRADLTTGREPGPSAELVHALRRALRRPSEGRGFADGVLARCAGLGGPQAASMDAPDGRRGILNRAPRQGGDLRATVAFARSLNARAVHEDGDAERAPSSRLSLRDREAARVVGRAGVRGQSASRRAVRNLPAVSGTAGWSTVAASTPG